MKYFGLMLMVMLLLINDYNPDIVGPANQGGCIIRCVGNLAYERGIPYEISRDCRSWVDEITAEPLPTLTKSLS
jgi:hypothetical protein